MKRAPRRLQRKRSAGYRMPKGAVYVGRPTKWGNPHQVQSVTVLSPGITQRQAEASARAYAVARYESDLKEGRLGVTLFDVSNELRGKDLACWCPLPKPGEVDTCHAAILLRIANADNRKRRFAVSCLVTCEVELSQPLLDAVLTDEWRASFYKFFSPGEIAEHLAGNLLQGRSLAVLDGFADRDASEAQLHGVDFDDFEVRELQTEPEKVRRRGRSS